MKAKPPTKFVEDLLLEEKINSRAVINAKFKHPLIHWIKVQLWFFLNDLQLKITNFMFFVRSFLNKDK
jgi:hypothetical protein